MGKSITQTPYYLQKAIKDFFKPFILKLALLPFIISLVFWITIFYFFSKNVMANLFELIQPYITIETSWLSWIQAPLEILTHTFLFIIIVIVFWLSQFLTLMLINAFLTPFVVKFIHKQHYSSILIQPDTNFFVSLLLLIIPYVIYAMLFLCLLPFYFIPPIWIIGITLLNYWLFSKRQVQDVGENIFSQQEFAPTKQTHKNAIRSLIIPLFLLSLIPFVGFFVPLFSSVALTHLFFHIKGDLKNGNSN